MRAISHLGFLIFDGWIMPCTLRRINAPVPACEKFLFSRAIRLHTSQIAAVILFDLETVDIRRVGTRAGESRRGVFRVQDLTVRSASRATMSHAQKQA